MKSQRVRHNGVTNTLTFFQRAIWGFPDGPVVKNSPAIQETQQTRVNGHEFEQTLGDSGQRNLACCSP